MKTNLQLSIIIPFYNVEKYIAECLDSVYAQDMPESEYEVICVNDCSPDNSREIVLAYQKKHDNLILIEHETNKMLGAARNTGLRAAKGDYVWFIDSDDYIEINVFRKLLNRLFSNDLEILQFNIQKVTDEKEFLETIFFPVQIKIITGLSYCKEYLFSNWNLSAWNRIYKRVLLIDNLFYYPEGVFYEDSVHSLNSLFACNRFSYLTDVIYFYRMTPTSIMNTNNESGIKLADRVLLNIDSINCVYYHYPDSEIEFRDKFINSNIWALNKMIKKILFLTKKERFLYYESINKMNLAVIKDYMKWQNFIFYKYPKLIKTVLLFISPLLRLIKYAKIRV